MEFNAALKLLISSFDNNETLSMIVTTRKKSSRLSKWSDEDSIFLLASKVVGLANRLK